jgi:hypothetical protein
LEVQMLTRQHVVSDLNASSIEHHAVEVGAEVVPELDVEPNSHRKVGPKSALSPALPSSKRSSASRPAGPSQKLAL